MRATIFATFVAGTTALGALGCTKSEPEAPTTEIAPPPAAPSAAAPQAEAAPAAPTTAAVAEGKGSVSGSVAFAGKAPKTGSVSGAIPPDCGVKSIPDESVLVNANNTLRNVLVRIKGIAKVYDPPTEPAVIDQQGCLYHPRVQGVIVGQPLLVKNGDKAMHNVHTYRGSNRGEPTEFNEAMPPIAGMTERTKQSKDFKAPKDDIMLWACDVHPWMASYLYMSTNPFFVVTGEDGSFTIKDVPAGKYTLEAWHEKFGLKTVEITVEPDKTAETKFEYSGT